MSCPWTGGGGGSKSSSSLNRLVEIYPNAKSLLVAWVNIVVFLMLLSILPKMTVNFCHLFGRFCGSVKFLRYFWSQSFHILLYFCVFFVAKFKWKNDAMLFCQFWNKLATNFNKCPQNVYKMWKKEWKKKKLVKSTFVKTKNGHFARKLFQQFLVHHETGSEKYFIMCMISLN